VTPPRLIVLATSNPGKVRELEALLNDWLTTEHTECTEGRHGDGTGTGTAVRLALIGETADGGARNVLPHIPYGSLVELEASEEAVIININTQEDARACGIK